MRWGSSRFFRIGKVFHDRWKGVKEISSSWTGNGIIVGDGVIGFKGGVSNCQGRCIVTGIEETSHESSICFGRRKTRWGRGHNLGINSPEHG
jgi:hypothetical protein